ncbi:methyltransferase domain-containing protein [Alienimonas californiensis]|uniref:Methyltransferase domain protein n=1 Tax=Alienimonas californiensis TaxID=2527989 RepID=A0A517P845_9PLAN|nr:methyltransferase domain-containing protein [Alienimonas californiensis]QDT15550.1 Methyltransferase domain protein [Alienimonas californiensis]
MTSAPRRAFGSLRRLLPGPPPPASRRQLYNPAPELGEGSIREGSSWEQWEAIESRLPADDRDCRSAMDVGCANGFFTLRLAGAGFAALGVEQNPDSVRAANEAVEAGGATGVAFMRREMTPRTIAGLPAVDVVVFKSVMQQWAVNFGWEPATEMLRTLWGKAGLCLFFEIGESLSCKPEYAAAMPNMGDSADANRQFVHGMLSDLPGAEEIECLGYYPTEYRNESRHLFAVRRGS